MQDPVEFSKFANSAVAFMLGVILAIIIKMAILIVCEREVPRIFRACLEEIFDVIVCLVESSMARAELRAAREDILITIMFEVGKMIARIVNEVKKVFIVAIGAAVYSWFIVRVVEQVHNLVKS